MACSVVGPGSSIKAFKAVLYGATKSVSMMWQEPEDLRERYLRLASAGYHVAVGRLAPQFPLWHLTAVALTPGFLPSISEEGVWQALAAMTTTPLLRPWMEPVRGRLEAEGLLKPCASYGCTSGLLRIDTEQLDKIVSEMLSQRTLAIPRKH